MNSFRLSAAAIWVAPDVYKTTDFARPPELSPNPSHGHHWYGNAESYFLIGDALGEGMKRLLKK